MSLSLTTRSLATLAGIATAISVVSVAPAGADIVIGKPCGKPKVIVSNDVQIFGTECADIILPGPDTFFVYAKGGNDKVIVQDSHNNPPLPGLEKIQVDLGKGNDTYDGFHDPDAVVSGGAGADVLRAHPDPDPAAAGGVLNGGAGNDLIITEDGSWAMGDQGNDRLAAKGSAGCNTIIGDWGSGPVGGPDHVSGLDYCVLLAGGTGHDVLDVSAHFGGTGRPFAAYLAGGSGNDTYRTSQSGRIGAATKDEIRERSRGGVDQAKVNAVDKVDQGDGFHIEQVTVVN